MSRHFSCTLYDLVAYYSTACTSTRVSLSNAPSKIVHFSASLPSVWTVILYPVFRILFPVSRKFKQDPARSLGSGSRRADDPNKEACFTEDAANGKNGTVRKEPIHGLRGGTSLVTFQPNFES